MMGYKVILVVLAAIMLSHLTHAQDGSAVAPDTVAIAQIPFEGMDQTWYNGSDRRDSSLLQTKYVTLGILVDANVTHSFNDPIDHTVTGTTELARNDEMEVSEVGIGGDFNYGDAHARIMTQIGTRSTLVPRLDLSAYRGQYDLADAYRYLGEANAGYHFNVMKGLNVDFGMFISYIGLFSYYEAENWTYQASYCSDFSPWYFNGIRIQLFPTTHLKLEGWIVNGWQGYAMYNQLPGFGGNLTWIPHSNIKFVANGYYGTDAAGYAGRHRVHSDNSFLWRYYHSSSSKGITKMALSATGDVGFEKGDGVNGFDNKDTAKGPAQYIVTWMVYNRIWFAKNKLAWCIGGGWINNPGRYLVIPPPGDASPLPNPNNPTQTLGTHPFTLNPGDQFSAWDAVTNISWMPNQSIEFKVEYVHRQADVPYFTGHGGVTSPTGYTYTPLPSGWKPDLSKSEDRIIVAFLFRI